MIETIGRHIEEGLSPMAAALTGSGEIGLIVLSISVSPVAVFIPPQWVYRVGEVHALVERGSRDDAGAVQRDARIAE